MAPSDTIRRYFDALASGDAEWIIGSLTDDFRKIGTEPGEIIDAHDAADYYRRHVASTEDFGIETRRLEVNEAGRTAWFLAEQTWDVTWEGTRETLEMRITGVMEQTGSKWKFAQIHASVGTS